MSQDWDQLDDLLGAVNGSVDPALRSTGNLSAPAPATLFPGAGESTEGGNSVPLDVGTINVSAGSDDVSTLYEEQQNTRTSNAGVKLIICNSDTEVENMCRGFVGGINKFCIKNKDECTTQKHKSDKMNIKPFCFYIQKSPVTALCTPCLPASSLPTLRQQIYRGCVKTEQEWKDIFAAASTLDSPNEEDLDRKIQIKASQSTVKTPAKIKENARVQFNEDHETFMFDAMEGETLAESVKDEWTQEGLPESLISFLSRIFSVTKDSAAQILGLSRDIQGFAKLGESIGKDMEYLDMTVKNQLNAIGSTTESGFENSTIWAAIDCLYSRLKKVEKDSKQKQPQQQYVDDLQGALEDVKVHNAYWKQMIPLLKQTRNIISACTQYPPCLLFERVSRLESARSTEMANPYLVPPTVKRTNTSRSQLDEEFASLFSSPEPTKLSSSNVPTENVGSIAQLLNERLKKMEDEISMLRERTSGDGVSLGRFSFQSPSELRTWLQEHLPSLKFGQFVDGVSIWYFFFGEHKGVDDWLSTVHSSSRIGFPTLNESKVSTSFQNVLPTVFGKGSDDSPYLPGLPTASKWDNNDGASGLRYRVSRELPGVSSQLNNYIITASDGDNDARELAQLCLFKSVSFVNDFSAFMTRYYTELLASKSYTKDQAWALISRCVKRCFSDMSDVRSTARDARDADSPLSTATQYLWAILRTHQTMGEYLRRNFEDHPSFASVITRFVTNNSFQSDFKSLESRVDKVEAALKKVNSRIDTVFNRLDKMQTKLDSL